MSETEPEVNYSGNIKKIPAFSEATLEAFANSDFLRPVAEAIRTRQNPEVLPHYYKDAAIIFLCYIEEGAFLRVPVQGEPDEKNSIPEGSKLYIVEEGQAGQKLGTKNRRGVTPIHITSIEGELASREINQYPNFKTLTPADQEEKTLREQKDIRVQVVDIRQALDPHEPADIVKETIRLLNQHSDKLPSTPEGHALPPPDKIRAYLRNHLPSLLQEASNINLSLPETLIPRAWLARATAKPPEEMHESEWSALKARGRSQQRGSRP